MNLSRPLLKLFLSAVMLCASAQAYADCEKTDTCSAPVLPPIEITSPRLPPDSCQITGTCANLSDPFPIVVAAAVVISPLEQQRLLACSNIKSAYSFIGCAQKVPAKAQSTDELAPYMAGLQYSTFFGSSVRIFADTLFDGRSPNFSIGDEVGLAAKNAIALCPTAAQVQVPCVNDVLSFYGINNANLPNIQISGVDLNQLYNQILNYLRIRQPFASTPAGQVAVKYMFGQQCVDKRNEGIAKGCDPK